TLQKQRHTHNHPHLQMLSLPRAVILLIHFKTFPPSLCLFSFCLHQKGIPIGQFCQDFNEKTEELKEGNPSDLKIGQPTVSYFLKQVAGLDIPGGCLWRAVYEIAQVKAQNEPFKMQNASLETVVKSIIGLARSLGVEIINELVEYLEHQHLWVRLQAQNDQKQRPFF
uniref:Large ribosomal subunit protein uL11 C-terminal domain-containing protein n=1 Tax=Oncorhynchus kisutch TaxID=8019 RepID=A0A8C7HP65_ONCKI